MSAVEQVEIDCTIKHETHEGEEDMGAYLVDNGNLEVWVPKKMVTDYCEEHGAITSIFIPVWLAEDKGLV